MLTGGKRSWIGIGLPVLCIAADIVLGIVDQSPADRQRAACHRMDTRIGVLEARSAADRLDPVAHARDIEGMITELTIAASESPVPTIAAAMSATATDYRLLLDDANAGRPQPATLVTKLAADARTVDNECRS